MGEKGVPHNSGCSVGAEAAEMPRADCSPSCALGPVHPCVGGGLMRHGQPSFMQPSALILHFRLLPQSECRGRQIKVSHAVQEGRGRKTDSGKKGGWLAAEIHKCLIILSGMSRWLSKRSSLHLSFLPNHEIAKLSDLFVSSAPRYLICKWIGLYNLLTKVISTSGKKTLTLLSSPLIKK